jgi:hypothetical protein
VSIDDEYAIVVLVEGDVGVAEVDDGFVVAVVPVEDCQVTVVEMWLVVGD